jgi:hypothetical protein
MLCAAIKTSEEHTVCLLTWRRERNNDRMKWGGESAHAQKCHSLMLEYPMIFLPRNINVVLWYVNFHEFLTCIIH